MGTNWYTSVSFCTDLISHTKHFLWVYYYSCFLLCELRFIQHIFSWLFSTSPQGDLFFTGLTPTCPSLKSNHKWFDTEEESKMNSFWALTFFLTLGSLSAFTETTKVSLLMVISLIHYSFKLLFQTALLLCLIQNPAPKQTVSITA